MSKFTLPEPTEDTIKLARELTGLIKTMNDKQIEFLEHIVVAAMAVGYSIDDLTIEHHTYVNQARVVANDGTVYGKVTTHYDREAHIASVKAELSVDE